ncbi:hypothetical protein [Achromobacter marplatensis]|uniref:hypothetical protein n=1 Tax=Achromobacter marplatensis TaxID=470868 RepID=UPI0039F65186
MQDPAAILDAFERLGWKNNDPMAQMLRLRLEDPKALGELVAQALDRALDNATFIDAALDIMDDDAYSATVTLAWQRAMQGVRSNILSAVLDSAALQHPDAFAGHWERLLTAVHTGKGGPEYLAGQAWRALDDATIDAWRAGLEPDTREGTLGRARAIALLRSRRPNAVLHAWARLFPDASDPAARSWLMLAGYARHANGLRSLHTESPLHIGFSAAQRKPMLASQPAWRRDIQKVHPTWNPGTPPVTQARMGGVLASTCGLCHAPLHRLLSVQEPALAGIDGSGPIEFATCLSCQGWESDGPMFYRHDADGVASAHPVQQRDDPVRPEVVADALQDAEVQLFTAPTRWAWQDWGESNGRQNLSRVGGAPSWVQSPDYPACPDCQQDMAFVMQLDSGLPQADGGEWLWGSGGCNYTFWCAGCHVSGQLWQCT